MHSVDFPFLEQRLRLFAAAALYWVEARTLVVADVHLGKAATFRAHGIALPAGTTETNLSRLTALLTETGAERLLFLGDLLHARAGRTEVLIERVAAWRRQFATLTIDLVLGNHDRRAGEIPATWGMRCVDELVEPPFVWRHEPGACETGYLVAGHVHPAVRLRGPGEALTLPCFYFGSTHALLPAFGDFTGTAVIQPRAGDSVFALVEDELVGFRA